MRQKIIDTLDGIFNFVGTALADAPPVPAGTVADPSIPGSPAGPNGAPQVSMLMQLFPFLAIFGVIYFLMIRPQQKRMKEQQSMLSSLKHGDEVITSSGILGKITGITDKFVTLEIADNVRIKVLKSQISQVVKGQIKEITS
ncbi:MAG: preprotein translocase subunit YajC [Bdellovibrionota bacterium]